MPERITYIDNTIIVESHIVNQSNNSHGDTPNTWAN